ncbi:MAG: EamA family transporter, partial [Gammaproteobacteria bacterium]|nr:EamA family transporter [Gammaproteobacteria bacterium]
IVILSPLPDPASWPYLLAGTLLHTAYQFVLLLAYRIGDLTQVYPIARGSAPILVGATSVLLLGVELSVAELSAIGIIGVGIMSLSLVQQSDGLRNLRAALLALLTGMFIAAYSLVDGLGARAAGTATGFYGWLSIANALVFGVFIALKRPSVASQIVYSAKRVFFIGGSASFVAYVLVIWAFTQAPIPLVTALRETSIVFALLIGVFFLRERINLAKVLATMTTIIGAAMLRFAKHS